MQNLTNLCQIIYYIAMSVAGPLAILAYLRTKKMELLAKEYETYDELDNRFFEYQKLALEYYDLDILDVPNNDPSLAFDKKRKQEMVAYAILFSLFERAYLMFSKQGDAFRQRQWSGWKHFLNDFLRREHVRTSWELSKSTYDTDFQKFMDHKIATVISKSSAPNVNESVKPAKSTNSPTSVPALSDESPFALANEMKTST
ncbi:hypothetical protein KIH39_09535 [Telmatocola sphagniphila]|uniref:Uncharacterized protein n=1 Tax=Telmatocola sphagniphila TaxID=1123043 RepID=A0A8E6BBJ0_9BACT|nr:hypothetical protein [Telmatocola sphagniphila]QVL34128.1 hypothetical protein KIH39_09535 [Telmatocola sphagniphila]